MAKGITPVIAIILLLLITIAVIGFATGFFQTIVQTGGGQAVSAANITGDRLQKTVAFVAASTGTISLKNTGGSVINTATDLTVLVAGTPKTCTSWSSGTIASGAVATCNVASCGASGSTIMIVAPGNTDSTGRCP